MNREEVLRKLTEQIDQMRQQFAVKHLSVFGSVARNEATETSDADILVEFDGQATFDGYMDLKFFLEELLGVPVDLVTDNAVRPLLRPIIEREAIRVAP
jgi:predicted nucleotidyltransferase